MRIDYEALEREENRKKRILYSVIALGVIIAGMILLAVLDKVTTKEVNMSEGLAYIKELEGMEVAEVEDKIDALEAKELQTTEAWLNRTPKEKFTHSLVMGDSITQGFTDYGILDKSIVIAERGAVLDDISDAIEKAAGLNPKSIFLCYGMNDVEAVYGDAETFKEQYKGVIQKLKEKIAGVELYVNCILPVGQSVIEKTPAYEKIPEFNETLKALCEEEEIPYIDNLDIAEKELYEQDEIHMKAEYFPIWAERMAEVAGL